MAGLVDKKIGGPAAWRGEALTARWDWIWPLSDGDVTDLERALSSAKRVGLALPIVK